MPFTSAIAEEQCDAGEVRKSERRKAGDHVVRLQPAAYVPMSQANAADSTPTFIREVHDRTIATSSASERQTGWRHRRPPRRQQVLLHLAERVARQTRRRAGTRAAP